jgi:hypothetical protein
LLSKDHYDKIVSNIQEIKSRSGRIGGGNLGVQFEIEDFVGQIKLGKMLCLRGNNNALYSFILSYGGDES